MKNFVSTFFTLVFILNCALSCTNTNEAALTQEQKVNIEKKINLKLNSMFEGYAELNADKAFVQFMAKAENFTYVGVHGELLNFQELLVEANSAFNSFTKAEVNLKQKNLRVISDKVVLCTFKQDVIFYVDEIKYSYPDVAYTLLFEKQKNDWIISHFHESTQIPEF